MKPSDEYYPSELTAALEVSASSIFANEQMAAKTLEFYSVLEQNSVAIDSPFSIESGNTPLSTSFVDQNSNAPIDMNGVSIDYRWQALQWKISMPYDYYSHEGTNLNAVSSWLQCEHPSGTRYDVLLHTLRSKSVDPNAPLSLTEVENSIAVAAAIRKDDASFNAFLTRKFSKTENAWLNKFDPLSPSQNELLLSNELDSMLATFTKK